MKIIRLLIILTAFLLMISSALSLFSNTDRTPVYQRRFYGLFNDSRYTVKLQE